MGFATDPRIITEAGSGATGEPITLPSPPVCVCALATSHLHTRVRLRYTTILFPGEGDLSVSTGKKLQCLPTRFQRSMHLDAL